MQSLRIVDTVIEHISATTGALPPESGGALLGVPADRLVTQFLFDPEAQTGAAVYRNSSELIARIERAESSGIQRFLGIVHSHPRGVSAPSGQDRSEFAVALEANEDLPAYVSPIVTFDAAGPLGSHELEVGRARISFYETRRDLRGTRLHRVHPVVLPVAASLRAVDPQHGTPAVADLHGVTTLVASVHTRGRELVVVFSPDFPVIAPLVLDGGEALALSWPLRVPPHERLAHALDRRFAAAAAPPPPAITTPSLPPAALAPESLGARSQGLLSARIRERSVLLVGAGSVGSDLAEGLARSGVGRLTLVDPDAVEAHNIGRSRFDAADVGAAKVDALAGRLTRISPTITVTAVPEATANLAPRRLAQLLAASDVVVAATDDPTAQALLDRLARREGRPAVFPGLYARAAGGEVIVTRAGLPCWSCATGGVRELATEEITGTRDYGTGRLVAEPGLVSDIQFVTAAATRIVLGLLDAPDATATPSPDSAHRFTEEALSAGLSYVVFAMRPDYWIFPAVLRDAAGQFAMQSIWMRAESRDDCPVCGPDPVDPLDFAAPSLTEIRRAAGYPA